MNTQPSSPEPGCLGVGLGLLRRLQWRHVKRPALFRQLRARKHGSSPPQLVVVYDTNIYRELSWHAAEEIISKELASGVVGRASYFVADEMTCHLGGDDPKEFQMSLQALSRLWLHCSVPSANDDILMFVADSEAQMCYHLFHKVIPRRTQATSLRAGTIGEIVHRPPRVWSELTREAVRHIAEHVVQTQERFVSDLFHRVVRTISPAASSWQDASAKGPTRDALLKRIRRGDGLPLIAEAIAIKAAHDANVTMFSHERGQKAKLVLEHYATAVHVYGSLIEDIILNGMDASLGKHHNTIWDMQVAMSTAPGARMQGLPIWVVTQDRRIRRAAKNAGTSHWFRSPSDYFELLNSPAQLKDEIDAS